MPDLTALWKSATTGSVLGRLRETLHNAEESSKNKGRDINISIGDLIELWEKQQGRCFYSNIPMSFDGVDQYRTVSLDRMDSTKGYVHGNLVLCCTIVNIMKNNMPAEHLLAWCQNIVHHMSTTGF